MALALVAGMAVAGLALAVVAAQAGTWSPPVVAPETVVAKVHHESVTWAAVEERLEAAAVMGRPRPGDLATWRVTVQTALDSIVGDVLTRHLMEGQGVYIRDETIDAEVAKIRQTYGGEEGLRRAMAGMQVSMAQLRETQRRGLYTQAMIDRFVPVTEADIDAYLAKSGAGDVSRTEAVALVRSEAAARVIPGILTELRADPRVWLIDVPSLG